jgi:hypothetical protein
MHRTSFSLLLLFASAISSLSLGAEERADSPSSLTDRFEFANVLPEKTMKSLQDYREHRILSNGREYGSVARSFRLQGKSALEVKLAFAPLGCPLKEDVIREPKANSPLLNPQGQPSPLWIWICEDGSVVRIKPEGDPTNRFRPQPHGSKSLRYPADGKFESFEDETIKIDEEGNPIAKWPKDLQVADPKILNAWADRAHSDLAPPPPPMPLLTSEGRVMTGQGAPSLLENRLGASASRLKLSQPLPGEKRYRSSPPLFFFGPWRTLDLEKVLIEK